MLATETEEQANELDDYREMLRPCLNMLTPVNRELIERRYYRAMSVAHVADAVDRSVSAVKVALLRIRRMLADCVEKRMAARG
jgi:RNA polymerase sigma-70 factor (ECF subfamily)